MGGDLYLYLFGELEPLTFVIKAVRFLPLRIFELLKANKLKNRNPNRRIHMANEYEESLIVYPKGS